MEEYRRMVLLRSAILHFALLPIERFIVLLFIQDSWNIFELLQQTVFVNWFALLIYDVYVLWLLTIRPGALFGLLNTAFSMIQLAVHCHNCFFPPTLFKFQFYIIYAFVMGYQMMENRLRSSRHARLVRGSIMRLFIIYSIMQLKVEPDIGTWTIMYNYIANIASVRFIVCLSSLYIFNRLSQCLRLRIRPERPKPEVPVPERSFAKAKSARK